MSVETIIEAFARPLTGAKDDICRFRYVYGKVAPAEGAVRHPSGRATP
jgi:hypothetical protein